VVQVTIAALAFARTARFARSARCWTPDRWAASTKRGVSAAR